jgi:hypothetical protein
LALLAIANSSAEEFDFTYIYSGIRDGNPIPGAGSVLTGRFNGTIDPTDLTGDTVIIDSFTSASLRGIPHPEISSDEFGTNPPGGTPSMTFSGTGTFPGTRPRMNIRVCPSGFVFPVEDPSDCNFGNDGGFSIYYNVIHPDGASFSGLPGLGREGRATDRPFLPQNWRLVRVDSDDDLDGVPNAGDFCSNTVIPESIPSASLTPNSWALVTGDFKFDTTIVGDSWGPNRSYTIEDTAGCSCEQIVAEQGLGDGHLIHGCSIGAMDNWVDMMNMP